METAIVKKERKRGVGEVVCHWRLMEMLYFDKDNMRRQYGFLYLSFCSRDTNL